MRDTLADSDRVAVVKVTLRSREALGVLRATGDTLVVHTLLWPEEVRDAASLAPQTDVTVRPQELAMASSYIESLAADFDPSQYTDGYRAAVEELVAAKIAGREVTAVEPSNGGGEVIDLVEALRASVQAAKEKRARPGSGLSLRRRRAPPRARNRRSGRRAASRRRGSRGRPARARPRPDRAPRGGEPASQPSPRRWGWAAHAWADPPGRGLPEPGQLFPLAALTPAEVQTFPGWPWVSWHSWAVIMLAAPSTSLAMAVDGFRMAAATWLQVRPLSALGWY